MNITDDSLEYVHKISLYHCLDIDVDDEGNTCAFPSDMATFIFKDRCNKNILTNPFSYTDYLNNSNIQSTIKGFNLDPLKFWYLILYIYDYTYCTCSIGIKYDSPKDQINKFLNAISDNVLEIKNNRRSFKKEMKITLEIKGKHKVVVDNPDAISYITDLCSSNDMGLISRIVISDMKVAKDKNEIEETQEGTYRRICYFAQLFISFFEGMTVNKTNKIKGVDYDKLLLIARIVRLAKFVYKEDYDQYDLKGVLSKYKDQKLNRINNVYF